MTGDAERVAERLTADDELRRRVRTAVTAEQVVEVLEQAGLTVTVDDVAVTVSPEPELSDAELSSVAGGTSPYVSVYVACQPSPPSQHFVFGQCVP